MAWFPHLLWELLEACAHHVARTELATFKPAHDVLQCGRHQEVLLLKPQLLALEEVVIWVEHTRNIFSEISVTYCLNIITAVEVVEVERCRCLRGDSNEKEDTVVVCACTPPQG